MKLPRITRTQDDVIASIVLVLLAVVSLVVTITMMSGCDRGRGVSGRNQVRIGDQIITAPPGSEITVETDSDESRGAGIDRHEGNAHGVGSGLTTESKDAVNNFNSTAPSTWLPGAVASGGSTDIESTLTGKAATSPLMWAGILAAVGGCVAFYFGLRRAALVCFGLAGAFIAASFIPAWGWIIMALAGVAAVSFYVWAERSGRLTREALRATVAGVETLPDAERRAAKSAIAVHADERDRATIKAIKKADDLPSERT